MGKIYKFDQAAVWLDGQSLVGQIAEIEMPAIEWGTVEHETLALIGTLEFPNKLEPMECTITWASYSEELANASLDPFRTINLQIRANYGEQGQSGRVNDLLQKIEITGRFVSGGLGSFSPGEMEREAMMKVDFVREVWDGKEKIAASINPPIYRVNGVDRLARLRANLGLGA